MSGTTQPAVKAALKAKLSAAPALSGVQILYGVNDEQRRETIWLGATLQEPIMEPAAFRAGGGARNEEYVLEVHCENGTKPTPEATEARAATLEAAVEAVVFADVTLGLSAAGVRSVYPSGVITRTVEGPDGPVSTITLRLNVKARLTP